MSTTYEYERSTEPVLYHKAVNPDPPPDTIDTGVQPDVLNSAMTNKTIEGCSWDEGTEILKVVFTDPLEVGDKTILDTIVAAN